jgi:hypothetical protein
MQYRKGTFTTTSTATARNIDLGFEPSKFQLTNYTGYGTNAIMEGKYFVGMADASGLIQTRAATGAIPSIITANGFTPYSTGASYDTTTSTITAITKALPGVVTVSAVNSLVEGATVTISNVGGMTQLNTNRYIVTNLVTTGPITFQLYDTFGNAVDTTNFGTYTSGGQINVISNEVAPPGLVYDEGVAGITLGSALFNAAAEVWYWEAFLETPTGY